MREVAAETTLSEGVLALSRRLECRRIVTCEEKEAVFRLRYEAYLREGAVLPRASQLVFDRFDDMSNTNSYGFYIDGTLASSIRISIADSPALELPAASVFEDILLDYLPPCNKILDPTRFVLDVDCARRYPRLHYVTLRLAWLASSYYAVDSTLATVRTEHQAFYRRFSGHTLLCKARPYPGLIKSLSLMSLDFNIKRERYELRNPFLRSTSGERERIFGSAVETTISRHPNVERSSGSLQMAFAPS